MNILKYKIACKTCLASDGMDHITLAKSSTNFIENRTLMSEYALGRYIKNYFSEIKTLCQFCGSPNLDIFEIEVNDKKAKIDGDLTQFQIVITHENGIVDAKTGGSRRMPRGFLKDAFSIIENSIQEIPENEFEEKHIGSVRFVVSTGFIDNDDYRTNRLEEFSFVGFSKKMIVEMVSEI